MVHVAAGFFAELLKGREGELMEIEWTMELYGFLAMVVSYCKTT